MVQLIDFGNIKPINFETAGEFLPPSQREREEELQTRAGLEPSTNYGGVREQIATGIEEDAENELVQASNIALQNGADAKFITDMMRQYNVRMTRGELKNAALEIAAGRREAEDALAENPVAYQNNYVDGIDPGRSMSKQESYSNLIERFRAYGQDRSLWRKGTELFRTFIDPGINQIRVMQNWLPEEMQEDRAWTSVGLGETLSKHIRNLWDNLDEVQFAQAMDDIANTVLKDERNSFMINDLADYLEYGGDDLLDAFSWFEAGSIGAGLAKKPLKALAKAGNTKRLASEAAEVVAQGVDKTQIAQDIITPTMTKAVQNPSEISMANTVSDEIGEMIAEQTAKSYVDAHMLSGIHSQDELKLIRDIAKEDVLKTFKQTSIDPKDVMLTENADGSLKLSMLIGSSDGHAVDSKRAHTIAKRLGLGLDEWELVKKDGEGFFVQVTRDVTDSGKVLVKPLRASDAASKDVTEWSVTGAGFFNSPLNGILKVFGGSTKIGGAAHARAVEADRVLQSITTDLNRTYRSSYNKLSSAGKQALDEIFEEGQAGKGKWFTQDELNAKHISDDVQKAYYDFKRVSDIEWFANNDDVRRTLMRKGYRQYGGWVGKEEKISTLNVGKSIVKDLDGNLITDLSHYNDADYILIRVQRGSAIRTNADYTHIIAPRSQLIGKELPSVVTHYMPGGRRMYTRGTRFVKIGSGYYNPITGSMLNGFAKTMTTGNDVKQLQRYADEVNKVIDIWKAAAGDDGKAAKMLADVDFQQFKVDNWEQVKELIKTTDNPKGIIDPNYRAQVLEHKQKYDFGNSFDSIFDDMSDTDTALQDLLDVRANYSRARGNLLDDINGGSASLVDISEVYDKTIQKAAYTMAKSELTHWYGDQLNKYARVIENWKEIEGLSDSEKLLRARTIVEGRDVLAEGDRRLLRAAERFLGFANRTLSARTKWDVVLENTMTRLAQFVDCALPTSMQRGKIYNNISKFNPAKLGRAIGFNYVMGWWNPAQLFKQGLGVINVAALEPVNATKAMLLYPLVRLSRASKAEKGLLKFYKDTATRLVGISDKDFDDLLKFIDMYGSESASGLLVGADRVYGEALRADASLLKKAWDTQYVFMKEGNAANFYIADIAAYLSKKGLSTREIAAYSDDLFINMTRTSESAFQTGQILPTTVMAQWLTYPMRMVEAMLNGRLTKAQRLRLLTSQLMLWGVGGTFLNDRNQLNMYESLIDVDVNPQVAEVITNGLLSAIAKEYGIRYEEGLQLQEQLGSIVDIYDATEGEFKLPSIPAAQAVSQGIVLLGAVKELVAPETDDYDFWRFTKYLATTKNLPSSMRNLAKGALAIRFQKFYDNRGRTMTDEATEIQAVAQMLGFGPYENKQLTYMYEALNDNDKLLQDTIATLKPYADAIAFYRDEGRYKEGVDKTLEKLYNEYSTIYKGLYDTLKEVNPYLLKDFSRQTTNLLFPKATTVFEGREQKVRKAFGPAQTYVILHKSEEISNNGASR